MLQGFWFPTLKDLYLFSPELALVGTMAAVLIVPLIFGRSARNAGFVALGGTLVTLFLTLRLTGAVNIGVAGLAPEAAGGMLILDPLTLYFKVVLLLFLTGVTALWFIGSAQREHSGEEFFILLLGSALGMILMTSTANLLMIAVAIELASLPSYAIVAFNKRNRKAAEASLKYVIFGAISAAIMLYGISLLYGLYNTLDVAEIASRAVVHLNRGFNTVTIGLGVFCFMGGVAFKIAAVPFHFWCPDAFEGAQIEVTTWLSVSSKAAALVLLVRLVDTFAAATGAQPTAVQWSALTGLAWGLGLMAAVTCTWGNFAAYRQSNIKRMLAYSSIAHAGYMMMAAAIFVHPGGATAHSPIAAVLVYILIYAVMNLGAFSVAAMVSWQTGSETIDAFSGLGRRAPWIAVPMVFCLVSLVGLPPFAGFIGKLWILMSLGEAGGTLYWSLLIVAVVNTLVSLFFYFRIVKAMFLGDDGQEAFAPSLPGTAMVNICGLVLVLLGVFFIRQPRDLAARYSKNLYTASVLRTRHAAMESPGGGPDHEHLLAGHQAPAVGADQRPD